MIAHFNDFYIPIHLLHWDIIEIIWTARSQESRSKTVLLTKMAEIFAYYKYINHAYLVGRSEYEPKSAKVIYEWSLSLTYKVELKRLVIVVGLQTTV